MHNNQWVDEPKVVKHVTWYRLILCGLRKVFFDLIKVSIVFVICSFIVVLILNNKFGETVQSYYYQAKETVENSTIDTFHSDETSYIYSDSGKVISKLRTEKDATYLKSSEIPESVKACFVAIEDRRFYNHHGIDLESIAKACYLLVINKGAITRGGSTITQQLVKNVFLTQETTFERKFKEIFLAVELEKKYTKEQILEFYINNIYYGNGYYGIEAAAQGYFSKDAKDLSMAEASFLCAIPNSPTYYDPIVSPEHTKTRQLLILQNVMREFPELNGDCQSALGEEVVLKTKKSKFYNYEESFAIDCSVKYLMKLNGFKFKYSFKTMKGYNKYLKKYSDAYDLAKNNLYTGGYEIHTSINLAAQKELQSIINDTMSFSTEKVDDIYKLQAASTVIDNKTGNVIALAGGRSQKSIKDGKINTLNRAFQMYKQPGSTIKPLAVYTPALMSGYTRTSTVQDSAFAGGPHNSDGRYAGSIPLYYAVEQSKNVVAWRLFSTLGPQKCLSHLQNMKFTKIVPNDYYPAASLGGLTYGVTTVEMASGYATLSNDGNYREPTCITSFIDSAGVDLYKKSTSIKAYSTDAARTMTDILQGVIKNGTARGLSLDKGMPAAAKTGTTDNQTNGWFCGYSPYYAVSVWVGTDGTESLTNLWGATYPGQIWKNMQNYLNQDKEVIEFKKVEPKSTTESPAKVSTTQIVTTTEQATTEDNQASLISEIDSKLSTYSSLTFNSDNDVTKENSLYNTLSSLISQVNDSNLQSKYQGALDKAESNNESKINAYYANSAVDDEEVE